MLAAGEGPEGNSMEGLRMTTDATGPGTIVLIHGLWVTPRSWENWVTHYEAKGYKVLAPAYPGFDVEVEALREDPAAIEQAWRSAPRRPSTCGSSRSRRRRRRSRC
jgi:hypothetical protein